MCSVYVYHFNYVYHIHSQVLEIRKWSALLVYWYRVTLRATVCRLLCTTSQQCGTSSVVVLDRTSTQCYSVVRLHTPHHSFQPCTGQYYPVPECTA